VNLKKWRPLSRAFRERLDNTNTYEVTFTELHDRLMMLHMQAFGFLRFERLKHDYIAFKHIPIASLTRRTYILLNCTCVTGFNEMMLDAEKVRDHFLARKLEITAKIEQETDAKKKWALKKKWFD